jgi:8-oxo-dGTP pyrophosphatase MutT (NUDIX family)
VRDFNKEAIITRLRDRLRLDPALAAKVFDGLGTRSDYDLNPQWRPGADEVAKPLRPAAVLVGLVDRGHSGLHLVLTRRADHLNAHAGQISFPGGRIDPQDDSPLAAALREAQEEIGVEPRWIDPLGYLDTYETGTGFRILPVVALLDPLAPLTPHAGEVAAIFDVPLTFLMDPANHQRQSRDYQGRTRHYFAIPYGEHYIWGATAGMLVNLYEAVFKD